MTKRSVKDAAPAGATSGSVVDGAASIWTDERFDSGSVTTNGIETAYVRGGAGRPIVFVHGLLLSATEWAHQLGSFAEDYEVFAYDVRGHGRTGGSDVDRYDVELFADDLHALLDALDVEDPILVGHSTGGAIAQVYAATHPENVAGVVLLDTFSTAPLGLQGRLVFANLRFLGRLDRVVRYKTLNRWQLRAYEWLAPGSAGGGEEIQALMDADPTIAHREVRKLTRAVADFPGSDFDPAAIDAPALVLYGERIPAVMQHMASGLAAMLEDVDVTVERVPDSGHASNVDNPTFVNDAIRSFVERISEHRE